MSGLQRGVRTQPLGSAGLFDENRQTQGQLVRLASNMDKEENHQGGTRLPQFVFEENQSINYLVDSNDRINGTPFDFTVNMNQNLFRARQLHLSRAIIPKIRNVNNKNKTIRFRFRPGNPGFTPWRLLTAVLDIGQYGVQQLANEMGAKMTRAIIDSGSTGTVLVEWKPLENVFVLSTFLGGQPDRALYFLEDSSFIQRGKNLAPFLAFPDLGTTGVPVTTNAIESGWSSGIAGMLYTRYVTLHSAAVNQFAFAGSKTSRGTAGSDIIAILDVVNQLHTGDTFFGAFFSDTSIETDSPNIQIVNPQKQFQKFLDFQLRDEYGEVLDGVFPTSGDGVVNGNIPNQPNNELGITFYMYLTF